MAVAQIIVVPLGTNTPSVSKYVANVLGIIKKSGLKYELTSMCTIVQGSVDEILILIKKVHEEPFKMGALRVVTKLEIDDRRDKELTIEGKKQAVLKKLK